MARILVVDDVAFMRRTLSTIIKTLGYIAEEADGAKKAMELIEKEPPDLVFLDIDMPKMDGIEVLRWIRANEATQKMPVIICTAKGERGDIESALRNGASDYLRKPVDRKIVETRIARHLSNAPA